MIANPQVRERIVEWFKEEEWVDSNTGKVSNFVELSDLDLGELDKRDKKIRQTFEEFLREIGVNKQKGQAIMDCLTEDFWPNHSNLGEPGGHEWHQELMEAFAKDQSVPFILTSKGTGRDDAEAYSAVIDTAGNRATGLGQTVELIRPMVIYVGGVATGFCPSGTAGDLADLMYWQGKVVYLPHISKGITPKDEKEAHEMLEEHGAEVVFAENHDLS
ncbi:hypothetical protein [Endozoicomonas atrinae]|uniref:hypothetical protein n=1 Tax=Endozoicomonas atrinae TaxID=1333660 RepID=UPI003B000B93